MCVAVRRDVLQRTERIGTRDVRIREPLARRVEPEAARAWQDADAFTRRELRSPRAAPVGSRTSPCTPCTTPFVMTSPHTRCRKWNRTRPVCTWARTRRANGSTTPGPVPHVTWKRGTLFPGPLGPDAPRSAHPTNGNQRIPCACSHARISPAAKSRYASAHRRGHMSSARSKPAVVIQSRWASSRESRMPSRRCSGVSTKNSPPSDQNACPPRLCSPSWSSTDTRRPASAASAAATSPARPEPTTMTSASGRDIDHRAR